MTPIIYFDPGFHPAEKQVGASVGGRPLYELLEPFQWTCAGREHVVPAGFRYDYASVPRIGWGLLPPNDPQYAASARIHDYLYETHLYTRWVADHIMLEGFRFMGVPRWKRMIMYSAVRSCGWSAWRHSKLSIDYWRKAGGYPVGPDPMYADPRSEA